MSDYTSLTLVKNQLGITGTLSDTLITTYVTQSTHLIDVLCKRKIETVDGTINAFSAAVGTLTLDACEPFRIGRTLFFREYDVVKVDAVIDASGTIAAANYKVLPANSKPKYAIELNPGFFWSWTTTPRQAITIIGTLGYCTDTNRPPDITLAATKLAAWLYQNRDNAGNIVQLANGSTQIPANAPEFVMKILEKGRYIKDLAYA